MKTSIQTTLLSTMVLLLALAVVTTARAQEADATVKASADVRVDVKKPEAIRPNIRAAAEKRIEQNREVRNNLLDQRKEIRADAKVEIKDMRAEKREDIKDMRVDARADMKANRASTTEMFKRTQEMRKDIAKKMELRAFEVRKNALVKELTLSLANIANISTRIEARITKAESEGHSMTEAKALLATANEKLVKAKADVSAFEALKIASTPVTADTSATASTTAEVELTKPRVAGDTAIKSVKEARDAFQKVVVAIAHSLGVNITASTTTTVN